MQQLLQMSEHNYANWHHSIVQFPVSGKDLFFLTAATYNYVNNNNFDDVTLISSTWHEKKFAAARQIVLEVPKIISR